MKTPLLPSNESERLANLLEYRILDTLEDQEYDDITKIASHICQTPISLISLIDDKRQWFKSRIGLDAPETEKEISFCGHAVYDNKMLEVQDSRKDERFFDNPLVTGAPYVIFYTGVPLISAEGYTLGTLCVIDHKPRKLDEHQIKTLEALSNQVIRLLELRKKSALLEELNKKLDEQNITLERFAYVAAHDIKSPLTSIVGLSQIILDHHKNSINEDIKKIVGYINQTSNELINLVSGILDHSKSNSVSLLTKESINLDLFLRDIICITNPQNVYHIQVSQTNAIVSANKTALKQIFLNLISNGIKYNNKDRIEIRITFAEDNINYVFSVGDNGKGIATDEVKNIFDIFYTGKSKDRFGFKGTGIGLATVQKMVEAQGGSIHVDSELNIGTTFTFTTQK